MQQVMDPGSVGRFQVLDDEPDGCVVLLWLRGLCGLLVPAGSEGGTGGVTLRRSQTGGGWR